MAGFAGWLRSVRYRAKDLEEWIAAAVAVISRSVMLVASRSVRLSGRRHGADESRVRDVGAASRSIPGQKGCTLFTPGCVGNQLVKPIEPPNTNSARPATGGTM